MTRDEYAQAQLDLLRDVADRMRVKSYSTPGEAFEDLLADWSQESPHLRAWFGWSGDE